jgi:hypothetical protein
MRAQRTNWDASGTRMLQHSQLIIPFNLLWLRFFVTVHNCVHIIKYYIIINVIIITIDIAHYLYVYVDFVKIFSPT